MKYRINLECNCPMPRCPEDIMQGASSLEKAYYKLSEMLQKGTLMVYEVDPFDGENLTNPLLKYMEPYFCISWAHDGIRDDYGNITSSLTDDPEINAIAIFHKFMEGY